MTAFPGIAFLPCSYGWPIGLGISFGILEGTTSSDTTPSPFHDFGLPRTGSSSAVYPGSLDSLCSSSGISSYSAWALGLIWNGLGFAKSFSPTDIYMLGPIAPQFFFFFFLRILSILTHIHGERGESLKKTDSGIYLKEPNS